MCVCAPVRRRNPAKKRRRRIASQARLCPGNAETGVSGIFDLTSSRAEHSSVRSSVTSKGNCRRAYELQLAEQNSALGHADTHSLCLCPKAVPRRHCTSNSFLSLPFASHLAPTRPSTPLLSQLSTAHSRLTDGLRQLRPRQPPRRRCSHCPPAHCPRPPTVRPHQVPLPLHYACRGPILIRPQVLALLCSTPRFSSTLLHHVARDIITQPPLGRPPHGLPTHLLPPPATTNPPSFYYCSRHDYHDDDDYYYYYYSSSYDITRPASAFSRTFTAFEIPFLRHQPQWPTTKIT